MNGTRRAKIEKAKQIVAGLAPAPRPRYSLPCIYEGAVLEFCLTCAGEMGHVRDCDLHDRATRGANRAGYGSCVSCVDYMVETPPLTPGTDLKFDEFNLYPNLPGKRFNPSIIPWEEGFVFCWRNGWAGSDLFVCRMNHQLQPVGGAVRLNLSHPEASYGREDPRLFVHAGKLHVSFTGVVGAAGRLLATNVLYAQLSRELTVERVFSPRYSQRAQSEKNWGFFEHGGQLYTVYSIAPHQILAIDGERAELRHEVDSQLPWRGGELRGGAAPVRVGDEYWSFCHDRIEQHGLRIYRTALYAFEAKPPFAPTRIIPRPLLVADTSNKPADQYAFVVWTGGVARIGDRFVAANGIHDRWTEFASWSVDELNRRLVPLERFSR